tara:strand:+ start:418 stop:600 length:183 start_codon:yes stop_codon:yes gene_type:complete
MQAVAVELELPQQELEEQVEVVLEEQIQMQDQEPQEQLILVVEQADQLLVKTVLLVDQEL